MRVRIRNLVRNRIRIRIRLHIRANFARISIGLCMSMLFLSYVFCSDLTFAFFVKMSTEQSHSLSQIGSHSLPDPSTGTLGHYQSIPLRPGALEEATYTGGLAVEEVVGWAKGLATPPQLIHVDMRTAERARWFGKKGWATPLFRELQVALPGLQAVRLIPAGSTVNSLLGIMAMHTVAGNAGPVLGRSGHLAHPPDRAPCPPHSPYHSAHSPLDEGAQLVSGNHGPPTLHYARATLAQGTPAGPPLICHCQPLRFG